MIIDEFLGILEIDFCFDYILTVLLDNTFFEFPAQNTFPPILLRDYFKTTIFAKIQNLGKS